VPAGRLIATGLMLVRFANKDWQRGLEALEQFATLVGGPVRRCAEPCRD